MKKEELQKRVKFNYNGKQDVIVVEIGKGVNAQGNYDDIVQYYFEGEDTENRDPMVCSLKTFIKKRC